jgi:LDH2 family malate/lactate/ureidoglycolate dehydrogenase
MLDVLCGVLTGGAFGLGVRSLYRDLSVPEQCAHLMIVIDVAAFVPVSTFHAAMERYIADFRACRPAVGSDRVYLPGEIEQIRLQDAMARGVQIQNGTLQELRQIASAFSIDLPQPS